MQRRIVIINKHPVHVAIEKQFWECLEDIAQYRGKTLSALLSDIAGEMGGDVPSALRVYVLSYYQLQRGPEQTIDQRMYH